MIVHPPITPTSKESLGDNEVRVGWPLSVNRKSGPRIGRTIDRISEVSRIVGIGKPEPRSSFTSATSLMREHGE